MPSKTQNNTGKRGTKGTAPSAAQWLYDTLMSRIEPELTTDGMGRARDDMVRDSEEALTERMADYDRAFEVFDAVVDRFFAAVEADMKKYRNEQRRRLVAEEGSERRLEEQAVEHLLDSPSPS